MNGMMPRPLSTSVTLETTIRMMVCEHQRKKQQEEDMSCLVNNDNTTLCYVHLLYEIIQVYFFKTVNIVNIVYSPINRVKLSHIQDDFFNHINSKFTIRIYTSLNFILYILFHTVPKVPKDINVFKPGSRCHGQSSSR